MSDSALRERIARLGQSLFSRGLTFGSSGNISVRTDDGGWLMTPTGSSLGAGLFPLSGSSWAKSTAPKGAWSSNE